MKRILPILLLAAWPALADTTIKGPITFSTGLTVVGSKVTATSGGGGINQLTGAITAGPGVGSQVATLATQATNTVLGNATAGTASPTALAVGTCSATGSALIWTTNSGFGCQSSFAKLNVAQSWTAAQRGTPANVAISTATFTPNFDTAQNIEIDLTSACPCTLANPSTSLVAGQSGMIEIHQDGMGSRTIDTWGSAYQYVGGTSTITLSTPASAIDYIAYYVNAAATGIVLGSIIKAPAH